MKALLSIYLVQTTTPDHDHDGPDQAITRSSEGVALMNTLRRSQWIFQHDDGWFIQSFKVDKYLGIEGDANDAGDGSRVVAIPYPFKWDIRDSGGRRGRY
ncbi:hypothetical protein BD769DRAFT_1775191 [Suillus cothurnatus]|nr:hypothetical protein BD769DRAFT_1775191 [Suillus cothurnatus]